MTSDAVLRELDGMRALARSLVHGDAEADDLLQDAAVAALEHPPTEAPPRPWLAVVLRNRRRMQARAAARRAAREQAVGAIIEDAGERPDAALDRARAFERLGAALVALDEPFRTTVVRRYLDGHSAAEIAKADGVPAGTVRWRLKTGLDRLRAAMDDSTPRWQRAFAPLGAGLVKTKTSIALVLLVLLLGATGLVVALKSGGSPAKKPVGTAARTGSAPRIAVPAEKPDAPVVDPLPGQGRVAVDVAGGGPGVVAGRVINWSTGDGVGGADLTFIGEGGAVTVHSKPTGVWELAPAAPGHFTLTTISAPGFLPYAPELQHSPVHVEVIRDRAVKGITVFLYPALDYTGRVVDAKGAPVAGAKVRLLGTPLNEQAIDKLETEWTTDKDGAFVFHAADNAVFQATHGAQHGWAVLDGDVQITHQLAITLGDTRARDFQISGHVLESGKGVANVLVRAEPQEIGKQTTRSTSFATTTADGAFVLEDLDDGNYTITTEAEGFAPREVEPVPGGARDVNVLLDRGLAISGVVTGDGEPIPAYTLLVFARSGARRELVIARSIVDATGRFEVRVPSGDFDLQAAASGWAPSGFISAAGGARDVKLEVSQGATLRGQVVAADGSGPIPHARVMREARGGGASAQPSNAGTVTRADGTFELAGIPPGPVSITIGAGGFHPKIEAGMTASDGAALGPLTITLQRLKDGEKPSLELVGIGVQLIAGPEGLTINRVIPASGAADAGIQAGEEVMAVDGVPTTQLGLDGSISRIRGVEGTTVSITIRRNGKLVPIVVTRKKLRA